MLFEEGDVVVEVLGDGIGGDAVVLAAIGKRGEPAFGQVLLEAAGGIAVLADVEGKAFADQTGRIFTGPVEEDVGRLGAGQRHLDGGLVGLVGKVLVDEIEVRMGLLVLGHRDVEETLIVSFGGQRPHLDVDRLSGAGGGHESERGGAGEHDAAQPGN